MHRVLGVFLMVCSDCMLGTIFRYNEENIQECNVLLFKVKTISVVNK